MSDLIYKKTHVCTVHDPNTSDSILISSMTSTRKKIVINLLKVILATESHPQSNKFFLHSSEIEHERMKQIKSGTWIIHPFSAFRIYYEMWMAVVFFLSFITVPIIVTFKHLWGRYQYYENFVMVACLLDVVINFRTGYDSNNMEVVMESKKIAKHYVFGPYFVCDLLSSLPVYHLAIPYKMVSVVDDCFKFLKIVRLWTFLNYAERSLKFLKIKVIHLTLLVMTILIFHYAACLAQFTSISYVDIIRGTNQTLHMYPPPSNKTFAQNLNQFFTEYSKTLYYSSSFLLAADVHFKFDERWISYMYAIVAYLFGKLLMGLVTVIIVESYRMQNSIDYKYQAMLSQVEAFMQAYKLPIILRNKMRQYYSYMYDNKYFNETKIEKYISDKLKREIKFHSCKKMVLSVTFFRVLPSEILEKIVTYMRKELYLPGDVIIQGGTKGDCMYFLSAGTVSVSSQGGKEVCHLKDGDYFGEISLVLPNQKTTATVIAIEICEVYKLERKAFKKCLEKEAELYARLQDEAKKRYRATKHVDVV